MSKIKKTNPDDIKIGMNIRAIRLSQGLSQEKLAESLGVTFQQVQKYEKGTNRVGGSRMVAIAKALGVSINEIFGVSSDGVGEALAQPLNDTQRKSLDILMKMNGSKQLLALSILRVIAK